jgi:hypothetical protein
MKHFGNSETFEICLKWIYLGEVNLDGWPIDKLHRLQIACDNWGMNELQDVVEEYMAAQLTVDNVAGVYVHMDSTRRVRHPPLLMAIIEFLSRNLSAMNAEVIDVQ